MATIVYLVMIDAHNSACCWPSVTWEGRVDGCAMCNIGTWTVSGDGRWEEYGKEIANISEYEDKERQILGARRGIGLDAFCYGGRKQRHSMQGTIRDAPAFTRL